MRPLKRKLALLTHEFLSEQYVRLGKSAKEVGLIIGVGETAVRNALKRHGIPRRTMTFAVGHARLPNALHARERYLLSILDDSAIREMYEGQGLSTTQIGKHYGCHGSTILERLRHMGVPLRPPPRFVKGQVAPMKGRKGKSPAWKGMTKETSEVVARIVASNRGVPRLNARGEKHHNWKGGITPEIMRIRNSPEYHAWRTAVFTRDGFRCQQCGGGQHQLEAHHIKPFSTHPELRFDVANGQSLCGPCHRGLPEKPRGVPRNTPEYHQRMSDAAKKRNQNPEWKRKQSEAAKARWAAKWASGTPRRRQPLPRTSDEFRRRQSEASKARWLDPKYRQHQSEMHRKDDRPPRAKWGSEEHRQKAAEIRREWWKKRKSSSIVQPMQQSLGL